MNDTPKTIQIFFPDGHPRSIRIASITSRNVQAVLIPRNKLKEADKRNEVKNVGVYYLIGELDNTAKPIIYIGEAGECYSRVLQHNQKKDFWNTAIVVTSLTHNFTQAHAKYLEWLSHITAEQASRYQFENATIPSKPYIPEPMEADLQDNFETIKILTSALGYPIFEKAEKTDTHNLLFCRGVNINATGKYIEDGFLVLKDSQAKISNAQTVSPHIINIKKKLLESKILQQDKNVLVFREDYLFSSPSTAASVILGSNTNGWCSWKDDKGRTLDTLYRHT